MCRPRQVMCPFEHVACLGDDLALVPTPVSTRLEFLASDGLGLYVFLLLLLRLLACCFGVFLYHHRHRNSIPIRIIRNRIVAL